MFQSMFPSKHRVVSSGKKHVPSHPKQKDVGHVACCWVASSPNSVANIFAEQKKGNVLMYATNFQYLIVTTADHGKKAN